jgi:hypothetical protein
LSSAGTISADVTISDPKTQLSADLSSAGTITAHGLSRVSRRYPPRREYVWVYGLDGTQRGVIS